MIVHKKAGVLSRLRMITPQDATAVETLEPSKQLFAV